LDSDLEAELASVLTRERENGRRIHRDVRRLLTRNGGAWNLVGVLDGGREAVWQLAAYIGQSISRSEISGSGGVREREIIGRGDDALADAMAALEEAGCGFAWVHPDYRDLVSGGSKN
jgi:hypothetical protein